MEVVIDINVFLHERVRLVKKVMKIHGSPRELLWKLQLLYFQHTWEQLCRIDNYPHEGRKGCHVHVEGRVLWEHLTLDQAEERIMDIGKRMLKERGIVL